MAPAALAAAVVALLAVPGLDLVARPPVRRLALRRIGARPREGVLLVLGSLLGMAMICASAAVGDTLDASIDHLARTRYGPIDSAVAVPGLTAEPELERAFAEPVRGTDGVVAMVSSPAAVARTTGTGDRTSSPAAHVHEVDVEAVRRFGGDLEATGFAGVAETPARGTALLGEDLAEDLDARRGDIVEVDLAGARADLEVVGFVPRLGVAGFSPDPGPRPPVVFVAPGTIAEVLGATGVDPPTLPTVRMLVSNSGGVVSGMEQDRQVRERLARRAATVPGSEVQALKSDTLEQPEADGDALTRLFRGIGGFAATASLLLFMSGLVRLGRGRGAELGLLRAIGMRRHHLVRAFAIEGSWYAMVATALGLGVGVLVGRLLVPVIAGFLAHGDTDLDLRFDLRPATLLTAGLFGLTIRLVTVWLTSARIGQLVVAEAVHDLPVPPGHRRGPGLLPLAAAGVVIGGAVLGVGLARHMGGPVLVGPAVAAAAAVPLLARVVSPRVAVGVPAVLALGTALSGLVLVPGVLDDAAIPLLVVQGVILVSTAMAELTSAGEEV